MYTHGVINERQLTLAILSCIIISIFYIAFADVTFSILNFAYSQTPNSNIIQILNTSSYKDSKGNYHIIGEVNNTSSDPQTNVQIRSALYNSNDSIIGNYTVSTSLGTLRPGEISPFDIIIDNPQTAGNIAYTEFSTDSQLGISKPANLLLNVSNTFLDANGNPHISGNIINHGQIPESNASLVGTFYNYSGQIIGTEIFNIHLGNISQNQSAPFEIGISDNKTKLQAKSFSLNIQSPEDSMEYPINIKRPFVTTTNTTANIENLKSGVLFGNNHRDNNPDSSDNNNNDGNKDSKHQNDQRGKYLVDANGNHIYNKDNCSNSPGSSGGHLSECKDAEKEIRQEGRGEDSDKNSDSNGKSDTNDNSKKGNDDGSSDSSNSGDSNSKKGNDDGSSDSSNSGDSNSKKGNDDGSSGKDEIIDED